MRWWCKEPFRNYLFQGCIQTFTGVWRQFRSSVIFSVRDWRSSAESLLSSDMMSNFPPEQLFWSAVSQHCRRSRSDTLRLLSVYDMRQTGRTVLSVYCGNMGGTAVFRPLQRDIFYRGFFMHTGVQRQIVSKSWRTLIHFYWKGKGDWWWKRS